MLHRLSAGGSQVGPKPDSLSIGARIVILLLCQLNPGSTLAVVLLSLASLSSTFAVISGSEEANLLGAMRGMDRTPLAPKEAAMTSLTDRPRKRLSQEQLRERLRALRRQQARKRPGRRDDSSNGGTNDFLNRSAPPSTPLNRPARVRPIAGSSCWPWPPS